MKSVIDPIVAVLRKCRGLAPARYSRGFLRDDRGGVAIWLGLSIIPLLFFAGAGLDLSRSINQQAQIQGAADAAALAGASAYVSAATQTTAVNTATTYMNNFKTSSGLSTLTFSVTPSTVTSGSSVTLYKMAVTASAPISNTLMSMARATNTTGASATAQNPVYNITITMSSFNSKALDTNTISYYIVPANNSTPTSTTALYSNNSGTASLTGSTTIQMTASQSLGFMLTNTTDGNAATTCDKHGRNCTTNDYGTNQYNGSSGSVHYFYSHMSPPSKVAYPSQTQNCSLVVATTSAAVTPGSCYSSLSPNSAVNCVQASGQTLYFNWNDMGGPADDKDYNDAVYTVSCSKVDTTVSKGLVLTN